MYGWDNTDNTREIRKYEHGEGMSSGEEGGRGRGGGGIPEKDSSGSLATATNL